MTTKPSYTFLTDIDYDSLEFDPNEKEELPDAMFQDPIISRIRSIVVAHVERIHPPEAVLHSSNTPVCYDRDNLNRRVLPDLYLAFDVDADTIRRRKLYLPWEVGKPPDFALEVGSESTYQNDLGPKRALYARIGVGEYWRFDPTGGDYYIEPLAGELLVNGSYQPIQLTNEPDGFLKGYSPTLGRLLCWRDGLLELYDAETNTYHLDHTQTDVALRTERIARQDSEAAHYTERIARQDAEAARHTEQMARQDAEAARDTERNARQDAEAAQYTERIARQAAEAAQYTERTARQAAEARTRELEAELRRQQGRT